MQTFRTGTGSAGSGFARLCYGKTPDTATHLRLYFGIEPEFWLSLQAHSNLVETRLAHAEKHQSIQPRSLLKAA